MNPNKEIEDIKYLYKRYVKRGYLLEKEVKGLKKYVEKKGNRFYLKQEYRKRIKVYATGGVFEIVHIGHIRFFKHARKIAKDGLLVVVVAHDHHIKKKRNKIMFNQSQRAEFLESIKYIDVVVRGSKNMDRIIKRIAPDVVIYGYDQKEIKGLKGIKLKKYSALKTSKMIERLCKQ